MPPEGRPLQQPFYEGRVHGRGQTEREDGEAGGEAAPAREPFLDAVDAPAVYEAHTEAGHGCRR